jgi:hypothetical protein
MREIQDSHFGPNSVGKLNVSLQSIEHNNSKGASIRSNYEIGFLILLYSIILLLSFICHVLKTGVDAMATKEVKIRMICENFKKRKLRETDQTQQKTVSRRAPSINQKCSMTITIFLGLDNHFYLYKHSFLDHCYHPHQNSESILHGQKDMDTGDFDLLTLLCSVNVSPMKISQIMEQVKGPEAGTYHPKRVYDINQRTENLKIFCNRSLTQK